MTPYVPEVILGLVEIVVTDEFAAWFDALTQPERAAVVKVVDYLERYGVTLPFPYSSGLQSSKCGLRELRCKQGTSPIRIAYGFDPERNAVLLTGGDKSGGSSDAFYQRFAAESDRIWEEYLAELAQRRRP